MAILAAPWIGLASYTEALQAQFYGRDRERDTLFRLVEGDALTILFSGSGLGKSSLLQAALFPRLRQGNYLPVFIRLDHREDAARLPDQVLTEVVAAAQRAAVDVSPIVPGESLWEYFHRRGADGENRRLWTREQRVATPVLVFDQFEELFTLGKQTLGSARRGAEFIEELACLVENHPPDQVTSGLEDADSTSEKFEFAHVPLKVVLSLREDYLAHLEALRSQLPSIRHNRMRLAPLRVSQAREVVERPARQDELLSPGCADAILSFVSRSSTPSSPPTRAAPPVTGMEALGADRQLSISAVAADRADESETVDPALLSVFCAELDAVRRAQRAAQITPQLVKQHQEQFLSGFYERVLKGVAAPVREFVEDELVSPAGFRDSRSLDDALSRPGVTQYALDTLIDRRLLRIEERQSGPRRIELSHDLICGMAKKSREERRLRMDKEAADRVAQAMRRRLTSSIAFAGLLGVMLAASVFMSIKAEREHLRAQQAEQGRDKAVTDRLVAERAEAQANAARTKAELNSKSVARAADLKAMLVKLATASDADYDQIMPVAPVCFRGKTIALAPKYFLYDIKPTDDNKSVFPLDQVQRVTYKAISSHKENRPLIVTGTPETEFRFRYQGWGCYKQVLGLVEWISAERDPVFVKFDSCHPPCPT